MPPVLIITAIPLFRRESDGYMAEHLCVSRPRSRCYSRLYLCTFHLLSFLYLLLLSKQRLPRSIRLPGTRGANDHHVDGPWSNTSQARFVEGKKSLTSNCAVGKRIDKLDRRYGHGTFVLPAIASENITDSRNDRARVVQNHNNLFPWLPTLLSTPALWNRQSVLTYSNKRVLQSG